MKREDGATDDLDQRLARGPGWSWLPYAILVLIAVVFVTLVVSMVRASGALAHDDIISQLAASGHLDEWRPEVGGPLPIGHWASGADLRHFLEIDSHSSMAEVQRNLAENDIHPPLFFWALLGVRSAGLGIIWSGPILNLGAALLAGALLYLLLVEVLEDRLLAAIAVGVFAFSPALVLSVATTRQYPLQMLAAVILIWITARLLRKPTSWLLLFSLFAIGVLGLLTATPFASAIAGAVLVVVVWWSRSNLRAIAYVIIATIASGLVALAIHPAYFDQYSRLQYQNSVAVRLTLNSRVHVWVDGFFDLVTPDNGVYRVFEAVALIAGLAVLLTIRWWYPPAARIIRAQPISAAALGVAGMAIVAATGAYLLKRSPPHAAGTQYLILFWPGIVVLGAVIVQRNFKRPALTLLVVAALLVTLTARWQHSDETALAPQRFAIKEVSGATLVITDCLEGGSTAGAAMWVPPHSRFLLAAPGTARLPPVPPGTDRSRAFLFHSDACTPGNGVDRMLAEIGLVRTAPIGPIGRVYVYPLKSRTDHPTQAMAPAP